MQYASSAVARASEWIRIGTETAQRAAARVAGEARQLIDLPRWRTATDWSERFDAVSWKRAGVVAGVVGAVSVSVLAYAVTRRDPYTPRLPGTEEIAIRAQAIEDAPHAPPLGLVEANRPVEGVR